MPAEEVRAAIVVATYKQPGLLIEALDTALGQQTDFGYVIVVVNDGCPMPETHTVCQEFALRFPRKVRYLRQSNKGLSGARNAAIEFCLNTFADLEAVFFLDSDDRVYPHLLQRLFDALSASEADVGWVYTDMEMFGIAKAHDLSGRYTPSEHRIRNICPATSLVRRRMLDVGVRFDETMRFGAEDWDFWLQGIALGFRGSHVPWAGYRYRVRVESMVRGTARNRDKVMEHLFNKHAALFSAKALARSEAVDLPRYAVLDAGSDAVSYCTHPAAQREALTLADFMDRLCRVGHRPDPGLVPPFVTVIAPGVGSLLQEHGLLTSVLWNLEYAATVNGAASLSLHVASGEMNAAAWSPRSAEISFPSTTIPANSAALMIRTDFLLRTSIRPGLRLAPPISRATDSCVELDLKLVGLSEDAVSGLKQPAVVGSFRQMCSGLRNLWLECGYEQWAAADFDRHRASPIIPKLLYDKPLDAASIPPFPDFDKARTAVVVSPFLSSIDAHQIKSAIRRQEAEGLEGYFVLLGEGRVEWPTTICSEVPSLIVLLESSNSAQDAAVDDTVYLGTRFRSVTLPEPGNAAALPERRHAAGFAWGGLIMFDRVIFVGCNAYFLAGQLRAQGIETLALTGWSERLSREDPLVDPADTLGTLAVEHALDRVQPVNHATRNILLALGFPRSKLIEGNIE